MIDKKKLIEELLDCVADATDTKTQITSLTIAGMLMKEVLDEALTTSAVSGSCFGRISESVFSDLKSLDDLITQMGTNKDGCKNIGVGEPDDFKSRLRYFKEFLKKELPEFTEEDILKFDKHFQKFRKIYEWYGAEYFLTAMEYEARNNYRIKPHQPHLRKHNVSKRFYCLGDAWGESGNCDKQCEDCKANIVKQ